MVMLLTSPGLNWKQMGFCICCQWEQYFLLITKKHSSFRRLLLFLLKYFWNSWWASITNPCYSTNIFPYQCLFKTHLHSPNDLKNFKGNGVSYTTWHKQTSCQEIICVHPCSQIHPIIFYSVSSKTILQLY